MIKKEKKSLNKVLSMYIRNVLLVFYMNEIIYWTSGEGNNDVLNFVQHASILAICKFHVRGGGLIVYGIKKVEGIGSQGG
jgi:hypothetical protein